MSDNGKKEEVKVLLTIGLNSDNIPMIGGDLNNKKLCYHLLAEAIKIVADYKPPLAANQGNPFVHRMMNFARRIKK